MIQNHLIFVHNQNNLENELGNRYVLLVGLTSADDICTCTKVGHMAENPYTAQLSLPMVAVGLNIVM